MRRQIPLPNYLKSSRRNSGAFLALLALAAVSCRGPAATPLPALAPESTLSTEGQKKLDALLQTAFDRRSVAGAVALVSVGGTTAYLRAFGCQDSEAQVPMRADSIFRIASMTKPITSVAVLMLRDEGRLSLTDPVSKYLPEFKGQRVLLPQPREAGSSRAPDTEPARREVTIHDLLTHTSGLTYGFFGRPHLADAYARAGVSDGLVQTEGTTGENASKLARLPLLHQPGSAWEYGLSTDVLGHVIEVVSRMSLERFFEQRIFVPLRMADTHFFLPAAKRPRLAALYTPGPDKKVRRVGDEPVRLGHLTYSASFHYLGPRTYFSGGAGLVSTVPDYARFLEMLRRGGELDGVRVLSRESVELMTRNQIGELVPAIRAHGDTFGYGVGVVSAARTVGDASLGASTAPSPSPGTYSWGGIFNTFFLVDPQREVVAILMTQVYPFDHLSLRDDFKRLVYEALAEAGTPRLEPANRLER